MWGSHGLVHDLHQYSVDGIKKNKKEDSEAQCSMEVMAIQPMAHKSICICAKCATYADRFSYEYNHNECADECKKC